MTDRAHPPQPDSESQNAHDDDRHEPVSSSDPIGSDGQETLSSRLTGRRLGKYRLGRRLGAGAMSAVYRAVNVETGDPLALKVLPPSADPVMRSRFHQEAQMAVQLDHPNIVHTFDVGESPEDGIAYIALELVEGESLADLLERHRQLSVRDACAILAPIARALDYAHARGIIHRDVKPSNILLRPVRDDVPNRAYLSVTEEYVLPLLSDFGIARALDAPELTSAGRTVGTPAYMAPEQCSGDYDIDGRADIYALGAVFYRCLVGRPPYTGTTTQILYAHVYSPLMIPDEVLVNMPLPVVEMLRRMLMKEPQQRYATAGALADDLRRMVGPSTLIRSDGGANPTDMTLTMASLPATERKTQSSTMLVPAPEGDGPATLSTPHVPPSQFRVPGRRTPDRLRPALALVLIGLIVVAFVAILGTTGLRNGRARTETAAELTARAVSAQPDSTRIAVAPDGEEPEGGDTESNPPAGGAAGADNGAVPAETPVGDGTPEIPAPTFDVLSVLTDARYFYAERDWDDALANVTLLLRSNQEFNERLFRDEGTVAEIYVALLGKQPDHPFWLEWATEFDQSEIEAMLFDSLVGLAAQETSLGRYPAAADLWAEAVEIRPDDETINTLADATSALAGALPAARPDAREALRDLHVAYAAALAENDLFCEAAQQQVAAVGLRSEPQLVESLVGYEERCAEEIDLSSGIVVTERLDGTLIYSTKNGPAYQIYAASATDAAVPSLLVDGGAQPSMSPASLRMAFYSIRPDAAGLYAFDLGSGLTPDERTLRFTAFPEDGRDAPVSWNAAGSRIAFSSTREGDRRERVYVAWADGESDGTAIAQGKDPAWHPSADLIVYNGADSSGNRPGLWLMRSDGANTRPLTNAISDIRPDWSPEGDFVIFMSNNRHGNWELYRVDIGTGAVIRLTDHPGQDGLPVISPNGRYVAFASDRDGSWAIWVMPSEGGEPERLFAPVGAFEQWLEHAIEWIE